MQFVVNIEEIKANGLDYARELPRDFLEGVLVGGGPSSPESVFHATGPGQLSLHLEKLSGRVLLQGRMDLTVESPCKRCLAAVVCPLPIAFTLNLVAREPRRAEEGEAGEARPADDSAKSSFDLGEVDTELFDGRRIELDPILREQILLALPMDVVCKPGCRGLCSVCGEDLNQRECGHPRAIADPRWSALKDVKLPN